MTIDSKTVLVTRSTDGVGRLVALRLADQGARVLVHGRDRQRGDLVVEEIRNSGHSAVFLPADFASLSEVHRLADAVRQESDRLDILINNAEIGSGSSAGKREVSQDGYELRFAVNYLAGFQLTRLLLPLGWLALAYTIFIGGILGFGLWFWLIARCSMGRVAPFGLLLPVFAVISSVLFLGDHITPRLIVGGLLAISGVAITQVRPSARPI